MPPDKQIKKSDQSRTSFDRTASKQTGDDEDRLGSLADMDAARPPTRDDYLDAVNNSFDWFDKDAQEKLDKLRGDLKKEDEPDWRARLAQAILELALGAGAAAAGVRVTARLATVVGEATRELAKVMFENGVANGANAGRAILARGKDGNVIDTFIDAQKEGLRIATFENQTHFTLYDRHKVKTREEAKQLADACSPQNMVRAGNDQYNASRDAWVSYLAQAKYGQSDAFGEPVRRSDLHVGPTTTNMKSTDYREQHNVMKRQYDENMPTEGPSATDGSFGRTTGILYVVADLPEIFFESMQSKPQVSSAGLTGVNQTIASEYAKIPLSAARIPRIIYCRINGEHAFTVYLDENGLLIRADNPKTDWPLSKWLHARATVDHPENHRDGVDRSSEGLRLLLAELVASKVEAR